MPRDPRQKPVARRITPAIRPSKKLPSPPGYVLGGSMSDGASLAPTRDSETLLRLSDKMTDKEIVALIDEANEVAGKKFISPRNRHLIGRLAHALSGMPNPEEYKRKVMAASISVSADLVADETAKGTSVEDIVALLKRNADAIWEDE
jgi:hypothetical protein